MTRHRTMVRHFDDRERERLGKLFQMLGSDNVHEAEAARARINRLLLDFGKSWADLIELLGGKPAAVRADLASNIVALGSSDPDERADARRNIEDLLARYRKTWNDLASSALHEPWACDPLSDAADRVKDLLGLIIYILEEYVSLKPHQLIAVSLWILHTHFFDHFPVTPRLVLRSPTPGCGKSTLFDVLERLVRRPEKLDWLTTASLYHLIDATHPTMLLDESDNLGFGRRDNDRLRAVFNSGHRRGGRGALQENGGTRKFDSFSPLAMALPDMFGVLSRTMNERCITILMERSQRTLKRFDARDFAFDTAYTEILLWQRETKLNPDPAMPGVRNRFADNWRPLISIADALGYGEKARDAMLTFAREYEDADAKILLLGDIRKVFDLHRVDCLLTKHLLEELYALDGSEWCEFRGPRGDQQPHKMRAGELAAMLKEFGIKPHTIWPSKNRTTTNSGKGYRRAQFEEAWRKYADNDDTTSHANNVKSLMVVGDDTGGHPHGFQRESG
jgi:Protein of unknown function (DUF3631)